MTDEELDKLVENCARKFCRVGAISNESANKLIQKFIAKYKAGTPPNYQLVSDYLFKHWDIDIPRRAISEHIRGRCGCWTRTKI